MSILLEIGNYNDNVESNQNKVIYRTHEFETIGEAIAQLEFLKLGYDYFQKGEALLVRLSKESPSHLLNFDSKIDIEEIQKELEYKYNITPKVNDHETVFKVTQRKEENSLNSNFSFEEDENTKYAQTSSGEKIPFKLFNPDASETRSNLLREEENRSYNPDFALIERTFAENNTLQLFGSEKLLSHNDVAWLFKSLEDESIEQAFLVYHFPNNDYLVQHISSGTLDQALVDNKLLIGNILDVQPSSITLVHNHPSGNLKVSKADINCIERLKEALKYSDVKVNDGVIINLRSGKYVVFNDKNLESIEQRYSNLNTFQKITPYSFSKQIFVKNFQPHKVTSSEDVAKFISSRKYGISDKTEMLVLNNQLNIVAKFLLPPRNEVDFIISKITKFGGHNCIIYGNDIKPEVINFYNERMRETRMSIIDAILFKSDNGKTLFKSFQDEGMLNSDTIRSTSSLNEPSNELDTYLNKNNSNNLNHNIMRETEEQKQKMENFQEWINDLPKPKVVPPKPEKDYTPKYEEKSTTELKELISSKYDEMATDRMADNYSSIKTLSKEIDIIEKIIETRNDLNQNIMEQKEKNKELPQLEVGKLASVQHDGGFFKGKIDLIQDDQVTLKNLKGETYQAKEQNVYQFFNGQKYGIQEVRDLFTENNPIKFENLTPEDKRELMKGNVTDTLFNGNTRDGETYDFKIYPSFNKEDQKLELQAFKKENNFDISKDEFRGRVFSEDEINTLKEGKTISIELKKKDDPNQSYHLKVSFDEKLNKIIPKGLDFKNDNKQELKTPVKKDQKNSNKIS